MAYITMKNDFKLDFDDHRTSLIEKILVYLGISCMLISTVAEVIQAVQAWQVLK